MNEKNAGPSVLLIDANPDLCEIEQLILADAGFQVTVLPPTTDPIGFATQMAPGAIVIHIGRGQPFGSDIVDHFQADAATRKIPVVAIAMSEPTAAEAQAGPNVSKAVVAPFDITALEAAVATALGHPPPAAILPQQQRPISSAVAVAARALVNDTRDIVLRAVERLRQGEPYRSRFSELSTGLVDALGAILGAIATGLERGLTPQEVFAVPDVERTVDGHVHLRQNQGLGLSSVIREDQLLKDQVDQFLQGLVGQNGFTAEDALDVSRRVQTYTLALIRLIVEKYQPGYPPAQSP